MTSFLQVDFWDVGCGDASVIWIDPNRVILIDAGPSGTSLQQWVEEENIFVDLVIITHNDDDHAGGLLPLIRKKSQNIKAIGILEDRPVDDLWRKILGELINWDRDHTDHNLFRVECEKNKPLDLLEKSKISNDPFGNSLRLEAIYPTLADNISDQKRKKTNYASAIIVLWFFDKPIVAWPGDQQLKTCKEELGKLDICPYFLVGPHHGGPQDIKDKRTSTGEIHDMVEEIGHRRSWISVGWNEKYKLPYPDYLKCTSEKGIKVTCSQLTPHCHEDNYNTISHLLRSPTHNKFAIPPSPNKGPSCMGCMRVMFSEDGYEVLYDEEHRAAINKLNHPLCKYT